MSWDDSEPTMRMPRDPAEPEPTRILPTDESRLPAGEPRPAPVHRADALSGPPPVIGGPSPAHAPQPPGPQPPVHPPPAQGPRPGTESLRTPAASQLYRQAGSGSADPGLTQAPPPRPYLSQQEPSWRPVYPGQAWPTQQPQLAPWHLQQATAYTPPQGNRSSRLIGLAAVVALLVGLVAGAGAAVSVVALNDRPSAEPSAPAIGTGSVPRLRSGSVSAVAASLLPSVVQLKVEGGSESATGSGFVIDGEGHILTNNHVVSAAAAGGRIEIVTDKGTTASARLVGRSPAYDLAVVQASGLSAPSVQFGRSDLAVVGQDVLAIGSPLGLAGTVTAGIVSAKNRPVTAGGEGEISYINALQTDAAINPGNSGGPLVDMNGRVIGVNSAIATVRGAQAGNIGLGFAIPIDQARRTAQQLIATGKASYPVIGANVDMQYEGGARISEINPGSPAQKAGLRAGDVVTSIDGQGVGSAEALIVAIRTHRPGESIRLGYERDGRGLQTTVKLGQQTG